MIIVEYRRDEDGRLTVAMEGHAGFDENEDGHDLVCCAASILAYTLAQRMQELHAEKRCDEPMIRLGPGDAEISTVPRNRYKDVVTEAFETVVSGYRLLSLRYPDCIEITEL